MEHTQTIQLHLQSLLSRRQLLMMGLAGTTASFVGTKAKADEGLALASSVKRVLQPESALRNRAISDYRNSMQQFGGSLSSPIDQLLGSSPSSTPWVFDVVVIGSGYGASICAARIASKKRVGKRVCMLERGREHVPGQFPSRLLKTLNESMRPLFGDDKRVINNPLGLLDLRQGEDMTVMSANALGGTSLINANVTIRPDRDVFSQLNWPSLLKNRDHLEPYFCRVEYELGAQRDPIDHTAKMQAQRIAAENLRDCGAHYEAAAITVTRGNSNGELPIINRQGMLQRPCTDCGDCMTGCNIGAKNSLNFNYIPLARRAGAEVFSQTEVIRIEKCNGYYRVHYVFHKEVNGQILSIPGATTARIVVLGAGTMGSTELLMRSQDSCFQFSPRLGFSFSGNGDILGVIHGIEPFTKSSGFGPLEPNGLSTGPTIQSTISFPYRPNVLDRVVIQDGGVAKAYVAAMTMIGMDLSLDHTQLVLVSGHDGSQGRIVLAPDGQARVIWPGIYDQPRRKFNEDQIRLVANALGGTYREMIFWKGQVGTVHPLGGCAMSDSPIYGVTNHKGQVYDGHAGGSIDFNGQFRVHEGLYVADGAVIPSSLGANPLLTISAVAERTADLLVREPMYADLFVE